MQKIEPLSLQDALLITPKRFYDQRGYFFEGYRCDSYADMGLPEFVQDNTSFSKKGVLRGMHFQSEPGQDKLVSVMHGEIYDVIVDMRKDSPTFKQWQAFSLSEENGNQLFVPKGFAHGFLVVSETAVVSYKVSAYFNPSTEKGFHYLDPEIKINWPVTDPILSQKDKESLSFEEALCQLLF
jgi:dTDP-4-dehydrorhamnose 3,5-epimerase